MAAPGRPLPDWPLAAILALLLTIFVPTTEARASLYSCGTAGNFGEGKIYNPPTAQVMGARVDLAYRQANLCQTTDSDSTGWAMVRADGGEGWAQIGFIHKNYGEIFLRFFWQWVEDFGVTETHTAVFGEPDPSTPNNFKVSRYTIDSRLHMLIDDGIPPGNGQQVDAVTDFDPIAAWGGLAADWGVETQHAGDDFAGKVDNKAHFTGVESRDAFGNWASHSLTHSGDTCYGRLNTVSNSHFKTWTEPLDHDC